MAMYYYARKLQKAARKAKMQNSSQTPVTANGCIPNAPSTHPQPPNSTITDSSTFSSSTQQNQNPVASCSSRGTSILKPSETFVNGLVYFDAHLVSGNLESLIQHLVPTQSYYPDQAYIFAFLLASRLHIAPSEVLGRVFSLTLTTLPTQSSSSPAPHRASRETKVVSQMVQLLSDWTRMYPFDFRDERMMAHVRMITEKCVASDARVGKEVSELLTSLLARLTTLERHEALLHRMMTETTLAEPLNAPSILTVCPSPTVLAHQLAHLEFDRLIHIGPQEFVRGFPKETAQSETMTKCRDVKKTKNLESYLQWHYRFTLYVATEVCKLPKRKLRVRVIELWIEVARECFNIGNFNSLMAIIAGLNMSSVARLKKTWSKVQSTCLSTLEEQINPSNDYNIYRESLELAVSRAALGHSPERQRLAIPFLPLFVKDLRFLTEQCSLKLENGLIDFDKFWKMAKKVTEFIAWQEISCAFPKVPSVITSLQTPSVFTESALHLASYNCEAPCLASEKEHLKTLRGEDQNQKGKSSSAGTTTTS